MLIAKLGDRGQGYREERAKPCLEEPGERALEGADGLKGLPPPLLLLSS